MSSSPRRETALITGGSSGIGLELAKCFARDEVSLVLVARNASALQNAAAELERDFGAHVTTLTRDLSEKGAAQGLCDELDRKGIEIDYLVNNAGFGLFGKFVDLPLDEELAMVELNCSALTVLCKRMIKGMVERNQGRILNVASTAAFQPGPLMAVYYASKSYVLSLSEALHNELRGSGVTVTCLCPGPTPTGFQERAGNQKSGLLKLALTTPASVARTGYRGMRQGRTVVVPGLLNKLLMQGVRVLPRKVVTAISRATAEPR